MPWIRFPDSLSTLPSVIETTGGPFACPSPERGSA